MTATEAKWAERVRQWRASGKTAPEFAAGQGFADSTLRCWASELNHRAPRPRKAALPPTQLAPADAPVRIARVVRIAAPAAAPIVVAVGAARVEVRAGFDRALLREVVEALGSAS